MLSYQKVVFACLSLLVFAALVSAQVSSEYRALWNDPQLNQTIDNNIETFRKGDAVLTIVDKNGGVLKNARIQAKQLDHEFLFGCNIFFLKGFDNEGQNQKYETAFTKIFNFATAPISPEKITSWAC